MGKKKRCLEDKVPSLLLPGPVTDKANYNAYRKFEYRQRRLEKQQPSVFRKLKRELEQVLENWEKALNQDL